MTTMQQLTFVKPGTLEWQEVQSPAHKRVRAGAGPPARRYAL